MNNKEKVNLEARINRHIRVLKNSKLLKNIWFESKTFNWNKRIWYSISFCMIFIMFIFPIYPSISNIVYTNTETEFDRSKIDENSILTSYEWDLLESDKEETVEHIDSYLSVNTILDDNRDFSWTNEILRYDVRAWDSVKSIAEEFKVSKDTILWANNMEDRELKVWEIIKVPTVTWYLYKVKKGDRIEKIASEYNISVESIEKQNGIKNWYLIAWKEIILPWAKKIIPVEVPKIKEVVKENKKTIIDAKNNTKVTKTTTKSAPKKEVKQKQSITWEQWESSWNLVWRKPNWRFAWWNCTWYVAHYKNVTWWWNANQWIRNARAKWVPTWTTAKAWSIVQFTWGWYNPTYWHVAIVLEVKDGHMIVSDMNYRRLNEVTVRKVPLSHPAIDWFIYVD